MNVRKKGMCFWCHFACFSCDNQLDQVKSYVRVVTDVTTNTIFLISFLLIYSISSETDPEWGTKNEESMPHHLCEGKNGLWMSLVSCNQT